MLTSKSAAHPPHHVDEAREAGRDERGVVDPHRLLARKPHHQRRHRDAVIHVGRDQAAAGGAALAVHDQVVALDLDVDAVQAQHRGGRGEAVGFLHAQFLQAAHARRAFGEGRRDRRAPDIRRSSTGARSGGTSTPRSAQARTRRSATSSPPSSRRSSSSIDRAHLAQGREQPGAQRVQHDAFEDHLRARHDQRRRPAGTPRRTDRPAPRSARGPVPAGR